MSVIPTAEAEKVRPPRRRSTAARPPGSQGRSRQLLAAGTHPVTLLPLLEPRDGRSCGQCVHRFVRQLSEGVTRTKCACAAARHRGGPDVPADFPACSGFEPAEPKAEAS